MGSAGEEPGLVASGRVARPRRDLVPLYTMAAALVCPGGLVPPQGAGSVAPSPDPGVVPGLHDPAGSPRLRRRVPAKVAGPLLVLIVAALVLWLAVLVYGNLVELKAELPRLIERGQRMIERLRTWGHGHLPAWAFTPAPDAARAEAETGTRLKALASGLVNVAAGFLAEAFVTLFYLLFLLLEASLPPRIRAGFPPNGPTACSGSSRRSTVRWPRTFAPRYLPAW